jgi:GNAT superfamily N-acetyltransferase
MSEVTTYYLEMKSPSSLKGKEEPRGFQVYECEIKQFQFSRFLYQFIGANWDWTNKLSWSDEQWEAYAEKDNLKTWVAYYRGSPAGYYELQQQDDGNVEITNFGLASKFIGKGFGGYLLSQALESAWEWKGTKRVWVHTCTLDHPSALQNYKARGMEVYRSETASQSIHETPLSGRS